MPQSAGALVWSKNLARWHLEPWQWGQAFKQLLEEEGVRRGKGGDRRSTETVSVDTVKGLAADLGVDERTARNRLKAADDYEALSESDREHVHERSTTITQTVREKKEQGREARRTANRKLIASAHENAPFPKNAKFATIALDPPWAWVEEMPDDQAFMELVLSNNQGELSPLEIGIHALTAVPKGKGGRGKKGGLSQYAEKVGKKQQDVSTYRKAGEVFASCEIPTDQSVGFLDKSQHLAAIHKLPKGCWPGCVEAIGSQSAADMDGVD